MRFSHYILIILLSTFLFNGCRSMRCRPSGGGGGGGGDMGGGGGGGAPQGPRIQGQQIVDEDGNPIRDLTPEELQQLQQVGGANSAFINGTTHGGDTSGVLGGIRNGRPIDLSAGVVKPIQVSPQTAIPIGPNSSQTIPPVADTVNANVAQTQSEGAKPANEAATQPDTTNGAPALGDGVEITVPGDKPQTPTNNVPAIKPIVVTPQK